MIKADLKDATIRGVKFEKARLYKTSWADSTIERCVFTGCDFTRAYARLVSAAETVFDDCCFSSTRFEGNLDGATFRNCRSLGGLDLRGASLRGVHFEHCRASAMSLAGLDLRGAVFTDCDLASTNLHGTNLSAAAFLGCNLRAANLSDASVQGLVVRHCEIYGISLWGTAGEAAEARANSITKVNGPAALELDGLHIAVFIASLLEGNGVRELVDGLTSTMVLVLGRFDSANKAVLDGLRSTLRDMGYTAVVFDSAVPSSRDATETVAVLGRLAPFVIADLTRPKSSPHELQQFVADCSTPVQAVVRGEEVFSMFPDLEKYPWVLPAVQFKSGTELIADLPRLVRRLEECNERMGGRHRLARRGRAQ